MLTNFLPSTTLRVSIFPAYFCCYWQKHDMSLPPGIQYYFQKTLKLWFFDDSDFAPGRWAESHRGFCFEKDTPNKTAGRRRKFLPRQYVNMRLQRLEKEFVVKELQIFKYYIPVPFWPFNEPVKYQVPHHTQTLTVRAVHIWVSHIKILRGRQASCYFADACCDRFTKCLKLCMTTREKFRTQIFGYSMPRHTFTEIVIRIIHHRLTSKHSLRKKWPDFWLENRGNSSGLAVASLKNRDVV